MRTKGPSRRPAPISGARLVSLVFALSSILGCRERTPQGFKEPPPDGAELHCAVSGERCIKGPETPSAVYENATYYFCSETARREFIKKFAPFGDR